MELKKFEDKDKKLRQRKVDVGNMIFGKIPPQARDLEEAVLGAILLDKSAFDTVNDIITGDAFYVEANQKIFAAAVSLKHKNLPIDLLTVVEELKSLGELDFVGGPYAVTKLTNSVVSGANVEAHTRIILQKYIGRELIRVSGEIINRAYDDTEDVFEVLDFGEEEMSSLHGNTIRKQYKTLSEIAHKNLEKLEELRARDEDITGVPTGFEDLDKITSGWQPTDLIILAARPSVGKTAFALTLAKKAAEAKIPVGLFSLEMSDKQLVNRVLSDASKIWLWKFRNGRMEEDEMRKLYKTVENLDAAPIFIDDTAGISIQEFRAKARMMKRKNNIGMIIVDYLQLMTVAGQKGNREQEISKISRDLKGVAKELDIPIIALSQLSRESEGSGKFAAREPLLKDLRESGAIEQDADVVMLLHKPTDSEIGQDATLKNIFYCRIAKHRNGTLEKLLGKFRGETQTHEYLKLVDFNTLKPVEDNWTPVVNSATNLPVRDHRNPAEPQDDSSNDDLPF